MHEINVIRGPGGCFSLFVNVPRAENMPRAVSTGQQNYKKPFLQILFCASQARFSLTKSLHQREHLHPLSLHFLPLCGWPVFGKGTSPQVKYDTCLSHMELLQWTSGTSFLP